MITLTSTKTKNNTSLMKIFKILMAIAGTAMLAYVISRGNPVATFHLISSIGFYAPCIFLMYFLGCLLDVSAWKLILDSPQSKISFTKLLKIHISCESLYRCLPMGTVAGETMKTVLLGRQSSLATTEIVSSLVLRKLFLGLSQGLYIGCGVVLGVALLAPHGFLEMMATGLSLLLLLVFVLLAIALYKGTLFGRIYRLLHSVPLIRKKLEGRKKDFDAIDIDIRDFLMRKKSRAGIVSLLFFGGWLTEFFETCLILVALSIPITIHQAMVFEPVVSLTRSLAFFLPGGIGVMDSGYTSIFNSIGIANAAVAGAAFVIIKRGKEILWIAVGLILLWLQRADKKLNDQSIAVATIRPEMI